ncbi:MAG TPA: oxygenase MpaB family protein, partial [Beutenbergiaceae bacterium]|nr:oxygenase MpaB family protein [Beutenbergiaceae bacterium]
PPTTVAELHGQLRDFRPNLTMTSSAQEAAKFVLHHPPITGGGRVGYAMLSAGAVGLLPGFAREMLGLKAGPRTTAYALRSVGKLAATTVRWGLAGLDKSTLLPPDLAETYRDVYASRQGRY